MSARHERPLRAFRTRAQFLLEELEDPDPAVSRSAARSFGWSLPRYASNPGAWRTIVRADVSYGDALDVIAQREGAENWRDFVANGSPTEHIEFKEELRAAGARDDARLRHELTGYALSHARYWNDLRVAQTFQDQDAEYGFASPVEVSGVTCVPDITGSVDGVPHFLFVQRLFGLEDRHTTRKLKCLSTHVTTAGGVLQVYTDGDGEFEVGRLLRRRSIQAEVVVFGGMYHHEIEDAIAADWWRDVDD